MALGTGSRVLATPTPKNGSRALGDALLASPGMFGADGREVLVILALADGDTNEWRAMGSYRVGREIVRTRMASGTGRRAALEALLRAFVPRHAGRRWRLMGDEPMAGWVPKPRPRKKLPEPSP